MKTSIFSIFILFFMIQSTFAQQDCVIESGCVYDSEIIIKTMVLEEPDCYIQIAYQRLLCNGKRGIIIHAYTAEGSCEALDNFSIYHYDINALDEYVHLALLEEEAGIDDGYKNCPPDPGEGEIIKIFSARCGIWVGCRYKIHDPVDMTCDNGYDGPPYPHEVDGVTVKVYKYQPCGDICCETIYQVCIGVPPGYPYAIRYMSKLNVRPIGECSGRNIYLPKTCSHGCR